MKTVSKVLTINVIPALIGFCASAALWGIPVKGDLLFVENASFEDDALTDGSSTGAISGWTRNDNGSGTYNPTTSQFPGGVPDGVNSAYSNGGGTSGGTFSQELSDVLLANRTYTLSVWVGNRLDTNFPGYTIQLYAGGRLLGEDDNTVSPSNGTFAESVIQYSSSDTDPGLGDPLRIFMRSKGVQVNFDDVRLTSIPEPGGCGLMIAGFALTWIRIRRRKPNRP